MNPRDLPRPDSSALAASRALLDRISNELTANGNWITFARYMELALYEPACGYYSGGSQLFGAAGDFVTAPETTELFGRALAAQAADLIESGCDTVLELGAGRGMLAADLLNALERRDRVPSSYRILEVSAALSELQRETLTQRAPHLRDRVQWLTRLPERIDGLVLANEVLDALPVALIASRDDGIHELGWRSGIAPAVAAGSGALSLFRRRVLHVHVHADSLELVQQCATRRRSRWRW